MTLDATAAGDGFVLTGTKTAVESAAEADWLLVTARAQQGLTQFLLPAGTPGVRCYPREGIDLVRRFATVQFDGAVVPAGAVVGTVGGAEIDIERQLQVAIVLKPAKTVGAMGRVFEFTTEWAFDRFSFGRPLASYQELKHRFADMALWLEGARAMMAGAARAVSHGSSDAAGAGQRGQVLCREHAGELVQDCIQMHGGIGVTGDHDIHLYLRRVTLNGGPERHRPQPPPTPGLAGRSGLRGDGPWASMMSPPTMSLEEYRARARTWLAANMPRLDEQPPGAEQGQGPERLRDLIHRLGDGGYNGICFPTELGGAGLSRFHHRAFLQEALLYELPTHIGNPGLSIIAPPILEFGTPAQKEHVAAMLRGDEIFVQMMSEPSGGSDMAGALTRAERDGEVWVLNGSKIWSSGAWRSTWGLVLVRTDWSVPKHRGLSMVLLDLSLPGVTINKIKMVNGAEEFCQEFR